MATTRTPSRRQPVNRRTATRPQSVTQATDDAAATSDNRATPPAPAVVRPQRVLIDGIEYVPAGSGGTGLPKVGVGVTTRNRNELVARVIESIRAHTPPEFPIIIVDDASDKPVDGADHRFDTNAGVARAKNKALELLMSAGVDHLILFDDDVLVKSDNWWAPYVASSEPHLAHSWNLIKLWSDDDHVAWHASGGTVLYYTRQVIADVGGMESFSDPTQPGSWGCDHVALSDRIHNRGWTTWRYADVVGSEDLFHELDRDRTKTGHKSTATEQQRQYNQTKGREQWMQHLDDDHYVEYRELSDVILTCLFTNKQAQQSGRRLKPTVEPVQELADSIQHGRLVVFHDRLENPELDTPAGAAEFAKADCRINVFFQRWQTYWQWLREHPEVGRVWCVDATDVTQNRDPFADMELGKLYIGWEPTTQNSPWLLEHHPEKRVQEFMIDNPRLQLLNPGLVGGDRATVMEFAHSMIKYFYDVQIDYQQVWQPRTQAKVGAGDVPAANLIGYQRFGDRLITGSSVASVFKAFEEKPASPAWIHK